MHTAPAPRPPVLGTPGVPRVLLACGRPAGGAAILAVLLWRLGTGEVVDGLRLIDARTLAAAAGLGAVGTVCSAWRWTLVAGGLGLRLPLAGAVADCYRSVFLNATLPGGVLGDVHRAVRSGRDAGDVGRGVRAVVWERTAGQLVLAAMALVVLAAFPSPVRAYLPQAAVAAGVGVLGVVAVSRVLRGHAGLRTVRADLRAGLLAGRRWLPIALASAVAVSGHLATFLLAARTAGADAPLARLLPLTLLALLAMGVPANVAGFGPREGVAAWAFASAGLSAAQGVATAVVYGALVLVAALPGAAVLLVRRLRAPSAPEGTGVV